MTVLTATSPTTRAVPARLVPLMTVLAATSATTRLALRGWLRS